MKKNKLNSSLLILFPILLLCSCSNDDEMTEVITDGTPLTVIAYTEDFTSVDKTPQTRASDEGYTTKFTNGDKIGVYAIKNGVAIPDCKNVPLTYDGTNWTGQKTICKYSGAKYFAYFPYTSDMDGKESADAIIASFNSKFTDISYQDGYYWYSQYDLIMSEPISPDNDKKLTFSFKHKMAMMEISVPQQKYKIAVAPNNKEFSDYILHKDVVIKDLNSDTLFTIKPLFMGDGVYRYLLPTSLTEFTVSGECITYGDKIIEYSKSNLTLSAGKYKRLNITYSGSTTVEPIGLSVGDFYYSDGSLIRVSEKNPPLENCIGIVMKVGKDDSGDWKDDCNYMYKDGTTPMTTIHGYVVALYSSNNGKACAWSSSNQKITHPDMNREKQTGFYGYKITKAIISTNNNANTLASNYPATYYATAGYELLYPSPSTSSGWFLPSAGQAYYWDYNWSDHLRPSQYKLSKDIWKNGFYQTSSENDASSNWAILHDAISVMSNDKVQNFLQGVVLPCLVI